MPDYPDFTQYAYIDIIAQSMGRLLNRPTYGGAKRSNVLQVVAPNADTEFISVAGEGMVYGGYMAVWANMTQSNSKWGMLIDGNDLFSPGFGIIADFNLMKPYGVSVFMTCYDVVTFRYGFILPYGVTFEESVVISYREGNGDTPLVMVDLTYALT